MHQMADAHFDKLFFCCDGHLEAKTFEIQKPDSNFLRSDTPTGPKVKPNPEKGWIQSYSWEIHIS